MSRSGSNIKKIVVPPLDGRSETRWVALTFAAIILIMAMRFFLVSAIAKPQFIRPYQRLDSILSDTQRTLYQSMMASVLDVVALREDEGVWPEAELLKMELVPPFEPKFLPGTLREFTFEGHEGVSYVDYIGTAPADISDATFILRVIDLHADYHPHPHPGLDYDPKQKVAVQIWMFPEPGRKYPGERLPEAGWWWVVPPDDPSLKAPPKETPPQPKKEPAQ